MDDRNASHSLYHRVAVASAVLSLLSLAALALSLPTVYMRARAERTAAEARAELFRDRTNALWLEMMGGGGARDGGSKAREAPTAFLAAAARPKRQYTDGDGFCRGCVTLSCPSGPPGPPGGPGTDGHPGDVGGPGSAGEDGLDVQLENEPELPCVVCPGGPPGPRGPQGERGRHGHQGSPGRAGPEGHEGVDGIPGIGGGAGRKGARGGDGEQGIQGDQVIAGVGIKGPKGPPGPAGPKGRPGPRGRSSFAAGESGGVGAPGEPGVDGGPGEPGSEGSFGPPGDPGVPAAYCPSDCGVQQIVAGHNMATSGMLGERMSHAEAAAMAAAGGGVAMEPRYGGYVRRSHDFVSTDDGLIRRRALVNIPHHFVPIDQLE